MQGELNQESSVTDHKNCSFTQKENVIVQFTWKNPEHNQVIKHEQQLTSWSMSIIKNVVCLLFKCLSLSAVVQPFNIYFSTRFTKFNVLYNLLLRPITHSTTFCFFSHYLEYLHWLQKNRVFIFFFNQIKQLKNDSKPPKPRYLA